MYEYIGILLGARPILHISRIKVKSALTEMTAEIGFIFITFYDALSAAQIKKFTI
jgi:hypothetical protein